MLLLVTRDVVPSRQFEWDTVAFEEQEEIRREFMEDEKTVKQVGAPQYADGL